jgi:NAD(P)-dependent dehydrogenase (short-subunit alcohol dehydrogenase family)
MTARTIVITGATRGLGRALLDHFIPLGHRVFGCGSSAKNVENLRRDLDGKGDFAVVDVADAVAVSRWAERILAAAEPPDLLINNAAVMNRVAPLWEVSAAEFDRLIDINVKGVANAIRAFVPAMVARKSGVIVNLSSGWGRGTSPQVAPYCASKFAVEGLTKALAQELPRGMAAVPLNPGVIDTDMLRGCWADDAGNYPSAEKWATKAAPFLLALGAGDNGKSLTVSG